MNDRLIEIEREAATDWQAGRRDGTMRYDRFVRSPETKRFVANGAHLSFRWSLRMSLRRKPTACHGCSRMSVRDGSQVGEACRVLIVHHCPKVVATSCDLELRFFHCKPSCRMIFRTLFVWVIFNTFDYLICFVVLCISYVWWFIAYDWKNCLRNAVFIVAR